MDSFFDDALTVLSSAAGVSIKYRRGAAAVTITTATRGDPEADPIEVEDAQTRRIRRDYHIVAASLVLAGHATLPIAGDLIEDGTGRWEVINTPSGRPFEYSSPSLSHLRIHTQKVV